jgi:hypothetical protein
MRPSGKLMSSWPRSAVVQFTYLHGYSQGIGLGKALFALYTDRVHRMLISSEKNSATLDPSTFRYSSMMAASLKMGLRGKAVTGLIFPRLLMACPSSIKQKKGIRSGRSVHGARPPVAGQGQVAIGRKRRRARCWGIRRGPRAGGVR